MSNREAELIKQTMQIIRAEMIERISRASPRWVIRGVSRSCPRSFFQTHGAGVFRVQSSFCIIAQGSKQMLLGEEAFRYDPGII